MILASHANVYNWALSTGSIPPLGRICRWFRLARTFHQTENRYTYTFDPTSCTDSGRGQSLSKRIPTPHWSWLFTSLPPRFFQCYYCICLDDRGRMVASLQICIIDWLTLTASGNCSGCHAHRIRKWNLIPVHHIMAHSECYIDPRAHIEIAAEGIHLDYGSAPPNRGFLLKHSVRALFELTMEQHVSSAIHHEN